MDGLSVRQLARNVPCRREHGGCGALPGEFCIRACSGRASYNPHRDRFNQLPELPREIVACSACGDSDKPIFHLGNQWCRPCTRRWYKAGMPDSGPPPSRGNNAGLAAWRSLSVPEVSREASELERGIAAEHLVCADLLLQGYRAFMTDQTCPYDVAVDVGNLIRVQVKSTRGPRIRCATAAEPVYSFSTARPYGRRVYDDDAFDLLALVALDIRLIAYLPPAFKTRSGVCIRQPGQPGRLGPQGGKQFADFPFVKAVAELGVT